MELQQIGTVRKFQHWPSYDLVYEWEDVLAKNLDLKFAYKKSWAFSKLRRVPLFNSLAKHHANTFCFDMSACIGVSRLDNTSKVIPCVIDFYLKENQMSQFIYAYHKNRMVLLSSKETYDFVKDYIKRNNIQNFNIGHLPLSISDKYAITPSTRFKKKYDLVLMGRQNPTLEKYLNKYIESHPQLYYVYRKQEGGTFNYYSSRGENLGDINTREKYINLMRSARCGLYATPGIDGGEKRTNGFSQVTPRFLELVAAGCHVIARYKANSDVDFYELEKFSPSVDSYEQFEKMLDTAINTDVNMKKYSDYLSKHYTSVRAKQLLNLIKDL